jgi:hypothetical protein
MRAPAVLAGALAGGGDDEAAANLIFGDDAP